MNKAFSVIIGAVTVFVGVIPRADADPHFSYDEFTQDKKVHSDILTENDTENYSATLPGSKEAYVGYNHSDPEMVGLFITHQYVFSMTRECHRHGFQLLADGQPVLDGELVNVDSDYIPGGMYSYEGSVLLPLAAVEQISQASEVKYRFCSDAVTLPKRSTEELKKFVQAIYTLPLNFQLTKPPK